MRPLAGAMWTERYHAAVPPRDRVATPRRGDVDDTYIAATLKAFKLRPLAGAMWTVAGEDPRGLELALRPLAGAMWTPG